MDEVTKTIWQVIEEAFKVWITQISVEEPIVFAVIVILFGTALLFGVLNKRFEMKSNVKLMQGYIDLAKKIISGDSVLGRTKSVVDTVFELGLAKQIKYIDDYKNNVRSIGLEHYQGIRKQDSYSKLNEHQYKGVKLGDLYEKVYDRVVKKEKLQEFITECKAENFDYVIEEIKTIIVKLKNEMLREIEEL